MDASSSQLSDSCPMALGASKFLQNLPSRGYFSSTVVSSNPGRMRVYLCVRDTSPPEDQEIKTNQQNILIRSLMLRNTSSKDTKGVAAANASRKSALAFAERMQSWPLANISALFMTATPTYLVRTSERVQESRPKRANAQISSGQEGSNSEVSSKDFQCMTVERLRSFLKARGLSPKGKKDELIARLKSVDS